MLQTKSKKSKRSGLCSLAFICLCLSLPFLLPVPPASSIPNESAVNSNLISPGSTNRREIAAGAKEGFEISLSQNQFLRISIDKGDLALSIILYGPTGEKLLEHISQEFEVVEISHPANLAGNYKVELTSREKSGTRRYEIRVQPLITVTAADRKDSEARQAMASAEVLRASWLKSSLQQAIADFDKAALIWITARDDSNAARAKLRSADISFHLSEYREALKRYQDSALLARKANDRWAEARASSRIARVHSYLGDYSLAEVQLNGALALFRQGETETDPVARNAYAEVLSSLAELTYSKGYLPKSLSQFELARKFFQDDRKGQAKTHLFAGYITGSLGQSEQAMSEITQALSLYRAINHKRGEGQALTVLGLFHSSKGKQDLARKLHHDAIEGFHSVGARLDEGIALNAVGQSYEYVNQFPIALNYYKEALLVFQSIDALDFVSGALVKVATMHHRLKNLDQALADYQECAKLSRATGKLRTEANVLLEIASVYADQGHSDKALKLFLQVQRFYESIDDRVGQADTLNRRGDSLFRNGNKKAALNAYNQALLLSEDAGNKIVLLSTLYNLARTHRDLGELDVALSLINRSLENIEGLRTSVASPDLRASYFSGVRTHYELCIDILVKLDRLRPGEGFGAKAFSVSESSRARSLRDLIREASANIRQGATAELLARERKVKGTLLSLAQYEMTLQLEKKDSSESEEVAQQMAQLRSEYHDIQTQLREQSPHLSSHVELTPITLEQAQHELRDRDDILLEYVLGDEQSYLFAITANAIQIHDLPNRKTINDAATEVYKLTTARQELEINDDYRAKVEEADGLRGEKARQLSQILFGPVAHELKTRTLLLVTEEALQYVPFASLPVPVATNSGPTSAMSEALLLDTNEIVKLSSMSTLLTIRRAEKQTSSPGKVVAVIADPVFSHNDERVQNGGIAPAVASAASDHKAPQSLPQNVLRGGDPIRLPYASEEADAISAAAPRGTIFVAKGFDANRETAMSSDIGRYQIVHFATHGFLDSEHPELSGIVLTMVDRNGVKKNGLMPLHDIYGLNLSAQLTVLSACQTALGKDVKGEGFVGLTHSFLSAGSKSVVASLWKVDDRATAALMAEFYDSMLQKGMTPAAALRAAKLKLMKDPRWSAPYYWAGFVLQGEYTNRIAVERNSWLRPASVLALLVVFVSSGLILFQRRKRRSLPVQWN